MINKKEITKMVKAAIRRDRGIPDRRLMHPSREWAIGLILCLVIVLAGSIYAIIVFEKYSSISIDDSAVEVEQLRYQRATALEAIEIYEQKQTNYEKLISSRPIRVIEPESNIEDEQTDSVSTSEIQSSQSGESDSAEPESATPENIPAALE
jgi:hypothetical protein